MTRALDQFIGFTRWLSQVSGIVAAALLMAATMVVCQRKHLSEPNMECASG